VVKGAPDALLARCAPDRTVQTALDEYGRLGMRVLAVARRRDDRVPTDADDAEHDLELLGLVAMEDPPRLDVRASMDACRRAGVSIAMITGDAPATAAAIGKAGVPEMIRRGIPIRLATGSVCAGGTLGILIPPSITMILYGISTETSIGRLFLAGVVPGIMLVIMFAVYAWMVSLIAERKVQAQHALANRQVESIRYTFAEKMDGLGRVSPFILIVIMIAYAMYGGIATPSEVAAISAALALALVVLIYKARTRQDQWKIFRETVRESTMILMIIAAAAVFSYMMSLLYVTQSAAQWLVDLGLNRWVLMAAINVFLLVAGMFLPPVAIILMVMPILTPVLEANNFDLIWFAVILTINMEIGLITPPVGLNLYVLKGVVPDVSLKDILIGSMPFVFLMFASMFILAFFPELALWLPNQMMGAAQ
jgi:tripartite ATP-independent transporter DctM subunit